MADFAYTSNPARIRQFLEHVQAAKKPSKLTQKYLESAGFRTKNDRALRNVMKFIGFVDSSGVPTAVWQGYRDSKQAGSVLAKAIRSAYSGLFGMYEDAHLKDDETVRNHFRSVTDVGK